MLAYYCCTAEACNGLWKHLVLPVLCWNQSYPPWLLPIWRITSFVWTKISCVDGTQTDGAGGAALGYTADWICVCMFATLSKKVCTLAPNFEYSWFTWVVMMQQRMQMFMECLEPYTWDRIKKPRLLEWPSGLIVYYSLKKYTQVAFYPCIYSLSLYYYVE